MLLPRVVLLLDVVFLDHVEEDLVQRRGADGVVREAEDVAVGLEEGEQRRDARARGATAAAAVPSSAVVVDDFAYLVRCTRRSRLADFLLLLLGSRPLVSVAVRHREPQLSVERPLLRHRARHVPLHPGLHPFHLLLARVRRTLMHHVHIRGIPMPLPQLARRPQRQHPPRQDPRPVRQRVRLLHRVRRDEQGAARRHGAEHAPHDALGGGVHARGGLVKQQDGRVADERDGKRELALVAAGEGGGLAGGVGRQADGAEDLGDVVGGGGDATDARVEDEVLEDGHGVDGVELRTDAEVVAGGGAVARERGILDEDVAAVVGAQVPADEGDGGGFAGAVRAEEGEDFGRADAEGYVVDGEGRAEGLGEVGDAEAGGGRGGHAGEFLGEGGVGG